MNIFRHPRKNGAYRVEENDNGSFFVISEDHPMNYVTIPNLKSLIHLKELLEVVIVECDDIPF